MGEHKGKTVPIEYSQVVAAYQKVRRGGKATGIDNESWEAFDENVEDNLYVVWNRLASGAYHPQAVREVEIPKKDGTMRKLGIPTLRDRIAQQVVKAYMEERIDKLFHENSYGYRPLKSAHDAIEQVRQNCLKQDWVIDMDICKFFDEIDHELLMKAVRFCIPDKWVHILVERWLEMPVQKKDGTLQAKAGKGTPQGGVISPLLANLFLHYAFDKWLSTYHPQVSFVRFADDIVIHCKSKAEAEVVLAAVKARLTEVHLSLKEEKTRIVYCKDYRRREKHDAVKFEFLGFSYQPRAAKSRFNDGLFCAFTAEISSDNQKRIREIIREAKVWRNTSIEVSDIAADLDAKLRGWINFYGKYGKRNLRTALLSIDQRIIKWITKKHKISFRKSVAKLKTIRQTNPNLFYHWKAGYC